MRPCRVARKGCRCAGGASRCEGPRNALPSRTRVAVRHDRIEPCTRLCRPLRIHSARRREGKWRVRYHRPGRSSLLALSGSRCRVIVAALSVTARLAAIGTSTTPSAPRRRRSGSFGLANRGRTRPPSTSCAAHRRWPGDAAQTGAEPPRRPPDLASLRSPGDYSAGELRRQGGGQVQPSIATPKAARFAASVFLLPSTTSRYQRGGSASRCDTAQRLRKPGSYRIAPPLTEFSPFHYLRRPASTAPRHRLPPPRGPPGRTRTRSRKPRSANATESPLPVRASCPASALNCVPDPPALAPRSHTPSRGLRHTYSSPRRSPPKGASNRASPHLPVRQSASFLVSPANRKHLPCSGPSSRDDGLSPGTCTVIAASVQDFDGSKRRKRTISTARCGVPARRYEFAQARSTSPPGVS